MFSRQEITLATYLFWFEHIDDPNISITPEQIQNQYEEARTLLVAAPDLANRLRNSNSTTEEEIMSIFYDVGKEYFGSEKKELFRFFTLLYITLWGHKNGPRFGVFAKLFGKDEFADMIDEKINEAVNWI